MDKIISFPHMGNYYIPISFFIRKTIKLPVMEPLPITKKTLELGAKYSPDFVCVPFKYNLGNYIESLDRGANILIQAGGGCRFGYYAEIQEQILKDLGYNFEFYYLMEQRQTIFTSLYKVVKTLNKKTSYLTFLYYLGLTFLMIYFMDKIDFYIRANIGFEVKENSFDNLLKEMLNEFSKTKGFINLIKKYYKYKKLFKKIPINKPNDCLKVGIIGELYTAMEPSSTYFLEKSLAKMHVEVERYTNITYLLILKRFSKRKILKECGDYCKYTLGADGADNVGRAHSLAKKGFDGLIHTKPFGCMPEISAMSILQKLSTDLKIPIMYLSFDAHTGEEGIKTRLEAFYDMIKMRRKHG